MDILLLAILSYALFRFAISFNISPWRWISRYIMIFVGCAVVLSMALVGYYGPGIVKDIKEMSRVSTIILPFTMLFQVSLFFLIRNQMTKYVKTLDAAENGNDNINDSPKPPKPPKPLAKDAKDFSYFR